MPSAQSSPTEPVGTTSTSTLGASPSFMMASSPNLVLISRIAASMAVVSLPIVFSGFFSFAFFCMALAYRVGRKRAKAHHLHMSGEGRLPTEAVGGLDRD